MSVTTTRVIRLFSLLVVPLGTACATYAEPDLFRESHPEESVGLEPLEDGRIYELEVNQKKVQAIPLRLTLLGDTQWSALTTRAGLSFVPKIMVDGGHSAATAPQSDAQGRSLYVLGYDPDADGNPLEGLRNTLEDGKEAVRSEEEAFLQSLQGTSSRSEFVLLTCIPGETRSCVRTSHSYTLVIRTRQSRTNPDAAAFNFLVGRRSRIVSGVVGTGFLLLVAILTVG